MAKKVTINKELCIGCGACTGICPNVFAIGDDGKAGVIGEADDDAAIDEAAAGCPVGAIEAKQFSSLKELSQGRLSLAFSVLFRNYYFYFDCFLHQIITKIAIKEIVF